MADVKRLNTLLGASQKLCQKNKSLLGLNYPTNTIKKNVMLDAIFDNIPRIYKFCYQVYSKASILRYGSRNIFSEEGTQH